MINIALDDDPVNEGWLRGINQAAADDGTSELEHYAPVFGEYTAAGKLKVRVADLVKVGPEGYIHGYICVRPPCGKVPEGKPDYHEAEYEAKTGKTVIHGDEFRYLNSSGRKLIGSAVKKEAGDHGYKIRYVNGSKPVDLHGEYAKRQDASKAVSVYHNVNVLRHTSSQGSSENEHLNAAMRSLAAGKHDEAARHLIEAEVAARLHGSPALATHIADTREALEAAPKPVFTPELTDDVKEDTGEAHRIAASVPLHGLKILSPGEMKKAQLAVMKHLEKQAGIVPSVVKNIYYVNVVHDFTGKNAGAFGIHESGGSLRSMSMISLAQAIFSDAGDKILKHEGMKGWWVPAGGTHLSDHTIPHEVGHAVATKAFGKPRMPLSQKFWGEFATTLGITTKPRVVNGALSPLSIQAWMAFPLVKKAIGSRVSAYATTNPHELQAELWAEFTESPSPREPARLYGKYVLNHLKVQEAVSSPMRS